MTRAMRKTARYMAIKVIMEAKVNRLEVVAGTMAPVSIGGAFSGLLAVTGTTGAPDRLYPPAFKKTSLEVSLFHPA